MKSLEVCDSTQNDDDKESGKETEEGQENKKNEKEDPKESLNDGDEGKGSDVVIKSDSVEKESGKGLETEVENNVNGGDGEDTNGDLMNSGGQIDETTPTSTDERRLIASSEDELKSETNCEEQCMDPCNLVSGSVNRSKEPCLSVEIENLNIHNSKQSQELKDELMDVDSPSAEDLYKDVSSIIETSPMQCFKEEEISNDNTMLDKDVQDERGFDMNEDTILDSDCDKENEKNIEDGEGSGFSNKDKGDSRVSLEGSSSECGIRVGECQTISGSDKDFLWSENDSKKCQNSEGNSVSPVLDESDTVHRSDLEESGEKDGNKCSGEDEVVAKTNEGNEKESESSISKSGDGKTMEENSNESHSNKTDSVGEKGKCSKTLPQSESVNSRKRKKSNENELAAESKKKKSECNDVAKKLVSVGESGNDSSPSKLPFSVDTELTMLEDQCETERTSTKRASIDDKNSKKSKPSGEETERLNTQETVASSFLTNLRGTLKNLTRSDLEELIVQKLCEVISERSTVGQLRRRAQALEENQERWKSKVQILTKQMREMEMVMKKYMAEVQKQVKENALQMVTPIKVTRSVGLQVSFFSSSSKPPKPVLSPNTSNPGHNTSGKSPKGSSAKLLPHFTSIPNPRNNKSAPSPQKHSTQSSRTPPSQAKKTVITRSDSGTLSHKIPVNVNRVIQSQFPGPGIKISYKPPPTVQLPQQQNGSKVIDLTEDDDKQPGSVAKQLSPIRVVNHLQSANPQINGRFTYYIPKTSSPGKGASSGQNRPVLIATPTVSQQNRSMMCPMPPLLFKGGNVGSGSQPQVQNNRLIVPKTLRHPAPLPQPPAYHIARKNVKLLPPRPALKISKVQTGIVLSWNMTLGPEHAPIASYQLYAYQESNSPPTTSLWKKVGDVKALPLPMACTLTQFMSGHKYHFAVRAVDHLCRLGPFSFPGTIVLVK